jgi:raffinose/stachyose/melibiose transport system substrate-binding protein
MKLFKKTVFLLFCILLSTSLFAAGQQEAEGTGAAEAEEITLVVWDFKYGEEEGAGPPFRKMDQMFMEAHPNVTIEHVAQPHDQYYEIIRAAVSAQEGPDVAMFHAEQRAYEMADFMVTLDNYVEPIRDDISQNAWLACTPDRDFDSGIKMVPLTTQGLGFYYNKELFKQAGLDPEKPPKSWTDFLSTCETLKKAGITPFLWGNTPAYNTNWLYRTLLVNFYESEGLAGFANGESNFTDERFVTVIEMMKEIQDRGYMDPEGASIPLFMDAINKFKNGKGAIFCGLLSDIAHWKDFADALGKDAVGYFPNINHPEAQNKNRQNSMGTGLGWGIMTWSKHKDVAAKYITHYVSGKAPLEFVNQTGALVPNSKIDYDSLGYPLLSEILDYLKNNAVDDPVAFIPAAANNDLMSYDELLFNSQEISVDEYIKRAQESLENAR